MRTFRADHQTPALLRTSIDSLDDIDEFLLILQHPVQLVVVSRTEIAHHVFVAEEEHQSHGIPELVHLLEVGNLVEIADIDYGEVFDTVGNT